MPARDTKKEVTDAGSLTEDIVEQPPPAHHTQASSPKHVSTIMCFSVVNMT